MLHKDFMVIFDFYAFFNFQNANVLGMNYSGQLHPRWPLILCNNISLFASKICIFLTMLVKCLIECNASDVLLVTGQNSSGPNGRIVLKARKYLSKLQKKITGTKCYSQQYSIRHLFTPSTCLGNYPNLSALLVT